LPAAASIGRRNDTLFRLALAMAHDAESHAGLLERTRAANAELSNPPLPDAEVRGAARMAWRYKMENRLMIPCIGSAILLPGATIDRLLTAGDTDAMALLALLHKSHRQGRPFAAESPQSVPRLTSLSAAPARSASATASSAARHLAGMTIAHHRC
jgi:hypothetical protein